MPQSGIAHFLLNFPWAGKDGLERGGEIDHVHPDLSVSYLDVLHARDCPLSAGF